MPLTQIQIIQSLGEAMNWLERELSWNVAIQEQRHLIGRIGELYAALMTGGQMAPEVNQAGYDVVSSSGEHISVKTTTQEGQGGHITFNANTLKHVDRVMVFFLNTEEMQLETLWDAPVSETLPLLSGANEKKNLSLSKLRNEKKRASRPITDQKIIKEAQHKDYLIREYESGTIHVLKNSDIEPVARPILQIIAHELNIPVLNTNGNHFNTRQLGSRIIKEIDSQSPRVF